MISIVSLKTQNCKLLRPGPVIPGQAGDKPAPPGDATVWGTAMTSKSCDGEVGKRKKWRSVGTMERGGAGDGMAVIMLRTEVDLLLLPPKSQA